MKKIKKLVIGGIESKFVTLILISMLLVAGVFGVSMLTEHRLLSNLTQETSERQISSMTGTTAAVIDQVIVDNMDRITGLEALMTDQMFQEMAGIPLQQVSAVIANDGEITSEQAAFLSGEGCEGDGTELCLNFVQSLSGQANDANSQYTTFRLDPDESFIRQETIRYAQMALILTKTTLNLEKADNLPDDLVRLMDTVK